MRRVFVLGNSHVAALKLAWDDLASEYPETSVTFFAARADATRDVTVDNGRLMAGNTTLREQFALTSGGPSHIDPNDFDAVVCYGGLSVSLRRAEVDSFSSGFARKSLLDRTYSSLMFTHVGRLREITEKPVFAAFAPLRAPSSGFVRTALMSMREACDLVQNEALNALKATVLCQPQCTLLDAYTTKPEFSVGSVQLTEIQKSTGAHSDGELSHMNKSYGEIWLREYLPRILRVPMRNTQEPEPSAALAGN